MSNPLNFIWNSASFSFICIYQRKNPEKLEKIQNFMPSEDLESEVRSEVNEDAVSEGFHGDRDEMRPLSSLYNH